MSGPVRIQRKSSKGWKMPENTVCVTRPGKFGNPFNWVQLREAGYKGTSEELTAQCIRDFRGWLLNEYEVWTGPMAEENRKLIMDNISQLSGKNLACWCPLSKPCHADVLLDLANSMTGER